jgi:HEAT repeat protein
LRRALSELFEAERTRRRLAEQIAESPTNMVVDELRSAVTAARTRADEQDRVLELEAVAQILGQLSGPETVDLLVEVLGSEEPEARHAAGMALEELAFERFKEVALGVERALANLPPEHLALTELPYLLIEVPEPGVAKLIHRFLDHPNEEVVAAAIEACVELGDPSCTPKLQKLESDSRLIRLDEEEQGPEEEGTITVGELAEEALRTLEALRPEGRR